MRRPKPETWVRLGLLSFFSVMLLLKVIAIWTEEVDVGYFGDEASRVYAARKLASDLSFDGLGSGRIGMHRIAGSLLETQPPADALVRAVWIRIAGLVLPSLSPVAASLGFSVLMLALILFFAYRIGLAVAGPLGGVLCALIVGASQLVHWLAIASVAEAPAAALFVFSLYLLVCSFETGSRRTFFLSGLMLLLVTALFRSEAVLVLPGVWIAALPRFGFWASTLYGLIAGWFTPAKMLIAPMIAKQLPYTRLREAYSLRVPGFEGLLQQAAIKDGLLLDVLPYFWVIALLLALSGLRDRRARALLGAFVSSFAALYAAMALGYTHSNQIRNLTFPILSLYLAAGLGLSLSLGRLRSVRIRRLVSIGLVSILVGLNLNGAGRAEKRKQAQLPQGVQEARRILARELRPGDAVFYDRLYFWSWHFLAHLGNPSDTSLSFNYPSRGFAPRSKLARFPSPEWSGHFSNEQRRVEAEFFIKKKRPRFLVVPTQDRSYPKEIPPFLTLERQGGGGARMAQAREVPEVSPGGAGYSIGGDAYFRIRAFRGGMAEILVFGRALAWDEYAGVERYLGTKYGIQTRAAKKVLPIDSPAALGGLLLWLDAQRIPASDGESVSVWQDARGQGLRAEQPVEAKRPRLAEKHLGTQSSVIFDGYDDFLEVAGLDIPAEATIAAVIQDVPQEPTGFWEKPVLTTNVLSHERSHDKYELLFRTRPRNSLRVVLPTKGGPEELAEYRYSSGGYLMVGFVYGEERASLFLNEEAGTATSELREAEVELDLRLLYRGSGIEVYELEDMKPLRARSSTAAAGK